MTAGPGQFCLPAADDTGYNRLFSNTRSFQYPPGSMYITAALFGSHYAACEFRCGIVNINILTRRDRNRGAPPCRCQIDRDRSGEIA